MTPPFYCRPGVRKLVIDPVGRFRCHGLVSFRTAARREMGVGADLSLSCHLDMLNKR